MNMKLTLGCSLIVGALMLFWQPTQASDNGTIPPDQTYHAYLPTIAENTNVDTDAAVNGVTKLTNDYSVTFKAGDKTYRAHVETEKDAQNLGLLIGKVIHLTGTPLRYTSTGATLKEFMLTNAAQQARYDIQICHYTDQTGCATDGATQSTLWFEDGSVTIHYSHIDLGLCVTPELGCTDKDNEFEYEKIAEGRYNIYTGR